MKVRKLAVFVVLLVLAAALMVACGGQEKSTSNTGSSTTASSNAASSATASGAASTFDGLEEKEVRVATTDEDYEILKGGSEFGKLVEDGQKTIQADGTMTATPLEDGQRVVQMGDKVITAQASVNPEYGYYEMDNLGNVTKIMYYPISELPIFGDYGNLIGTYGDIPVPTISKDTDLAIAFTKQNITAYKCKLVGCSAGWVSSENAIWNQNDLLLVANPANLEITDLNGQPRSTPMDWDLGEEVIVKCDGKSYQTHADCYIYAISDQKVDIAIEDHKVESNGKKSKISIYNFSKLEPGLYYFQDLGVYKIV